VPGSATPALHCGAAFCDEGFCAVCVDTRKTSRHADFVGRDVSYNSRYKASVLARRLAPRAGVCDPGATLRRYISRRGHARQRCRRARWCHVPGSSTPALHSGAAFRGGGMPGSGAGAHAGAVCRGLRPRRYVPAQHFEAGACRASVPAQRLAQCAGVCDPGATLRRYISRRGHARDPCWRARWCHVPGSSTPALHSGATLWRCGGGGIS
jgi:hypothetical protein